jgi:hypothetical protein
MRVWDAVKVLLTFDDPAADVDVSCYVRVGGVNRQRQIGGPTRAGTCDITFKNDERLFDPPWPGGTPGAFGWIRPGQRIQVFYDTAQVFDGHVDDWDHDWPVGGLPTATLQASDALARLAQRKIGEWLPDWCQRIGPRLTDMLARPEVDWSGATDFDRGAINLQGDFVEADTNALTYAQLLERTDGGRFFAAADNTLTYRGVNRATTPATVLSFTDDTSSGICASRFVVDYGSDEWYTQINVTRLGGDTQTASSTSPVTDLHDGGYRPLDLDDLLMAVDSAAMNLAEYELSVYQEMVPTISELRCNLDAIADADALLVAGLEFGDRIDAEWTPTGSGDPVAQTLAVEGLNDAFTQSTWVRTLSLSRLIGLPSWVIGTSQIGTGVLGV